MTNWYAEWTPGKGMRFTEGFLDRYGPALERVKAGTARGAPAPAEPTAAETAAALGRMAAWAREAQSRRLRDAQATARAGHAPKGWRAPMTGATLRARRASAGLSQRDLAAAAGVSRASLAELEAPRAGRGRVTPDLWEKLLGALTRAEAQAT